MKALEWIVKEAKKLKKEYPKRFTTWKEYVAQASAIYAKKHKGKSPVGKKKTATKKKVGYSEERNADYKIITKRAKEDFNSPITNPKKKKKYKHFVDKESFYYYNAKKPLSINGMKKTVKKKAAPKKKSNKVSSHKDTKSHNVNIKVVSGVNQSEIDFWIKCFAPRTKKLQLEWYRDLKQSFKTNNFNVFTPKEKGLAQLRALELLLNKKPIIIK